MARRGVRRGSKDRTGSKGANGGAKDQRKKPKGWRKVILWDEDSGGNPGPTKGMRMGSRPEAKKPRSKKKLRSRASKPPLSSPDKPPKG